MSPPSLLVLAFLVLQISSQSPNLYPNCAIIDLINNKCLKCVSDSFTISQDQCVAAPVITQPILISNTDTQNLPTTSIFYNQAATNQDSQSTSQNQVVTPTPQPTLVTASSNSQSSNLADIFNFLSYFSSNSQNSLITNQPSPQNNIFLPPLTQQTQNQQVVQTTTFQRGSYSDNNCKTVD